MQSLQHLRIAWYVFPPPILLWWIILWMCHNPLLHLKPCDPVTQCSNPWQQNPFDDKFLQPTNQHKPCRPKSITEIPHNHYAIWGLMIQYNSVTWFLTTQTSIWSCFHSIWSFDIRKISQQWCCHQCVIEKFAVHSCSVHLVEETQLLGFFSSSLNHIWRQLTEHKWSEFVHLLDLEILSRKKP